MLLRLGLLFCFACFSVQRTDAFDGYGSETVLNSPTDSVDFASFDDDQASYQVSLSQAELPTPAASPTPTVPVETTTTTTTTAVMPPLEPVPMEPGVTYYSQETYSTSFADCPNGRCGTRFGGEYRNAPGWRPGKLLFKWRANRIAARAARWGV